MTQVPEGYLGVFPGPAGENGDLLTELVAEALSDHLAWRRNYQPGDGRLYDPTATAAVAEVIRALRQETGDLLGRLRRSFPFHHPRYIAHQQSELTVPSIVGAVAGLLYNSNNVTSESGNVTVELEVAATSRLLEMVGYRPPPDPPWDPTPEQLAAYQAAVKDAESWGWCYLTSGGTSANTAALWVARNVTLMVADIAEVCRGGDGRAPIDLEVTPAGGDAAELLRNLSPSKVFNLPPSQAVPLLAQFLAQAKDQAWLWDVLRETTRARSAANAEAAPVIFVTGARHYSIAKAADLLGLAVEVVAADSQHRMDLADLETKLLSAHNAERIVVAVIAIVGTTEEGAVDPLGAVLDLRTRMEKEHGLSFWVHADAAWGGYLASLSRLPAGEELWVKARGLLAVNGLELPDGRPRSFRQLKGTWIADLVDALDRGTGVARQEDMEDVGQYRAALGGGEDPAALSADDYQAACAALDDLVAIHDAKAFNPEDQPELHRRLVADQQRTFLSQDARLQVNSIGYDDTVPLVGDEEAEESLVEVLWALGALGRADSVTIDPHKMGYQNYPCGAVAFRDDRCRYYVRQDAPYLTKTNSFVHQPTVRIEVVDGVSVVKTDSDGRYTLEGSRPSSQATALWLSTRVLPLDQAHHGKVVRDSWRAARLLHVWLTRWDDVEAKRTERVGGTPAPYRFPTLCLRDGQPAPPDTNLVIFGVSLRSGVTLKQYNILTEAVYKTFSIRAEDGQRHHAYMQPFFLSITSFSEPLYQSSSIAPLAAHAGITDFETAYPTPQGDMKVLRATVMNPYLLRAAHPDHGNLLSSFMLDLAAAADKAAAALLAVGREGL